MIGRHHGGITRVGEDVAHVTQRLRVVVHDEHRRRLASLRNLAGGAPGIAGRGVFAARIRDRNREDETRALAHARAFGPYAPAVGLDQSLADGKAQSTGHAGVYFVAPVFAKQPPQEFRCNAPALVGHRDRYVHAVPLGRDTDGSRCRRMAGGVGQQIVQHLHDAFPVGEHRRQVGRQVDEDVVPGAAGQERVAGLVHQETHLRGFRGDRQRARIGASRVEQVANQTVHEIGLFVDDTEELAHFGRIEFPRGVQHRRRRSLDGGQRRTQFVAHHAEKLGPRPVQFLQRRQVLHGDHHRRHRAVLAANRGGAHEHRHIAPVGNGNHDLHVTHRLGTVEHLGKGKLVQRDFASVGEAAGRHLE